jgi:heme-degrading monooxygenase HmoA
MYARVWKLSVLPDRVQQFAAACRSVGTLNRKRAGFRGLIVLRGGPRDAPESTVVSVWDSLEELRASESAAFQKAVARALACCKRGAVLREEEMLIWEFAAPKKKTKRHSSRRAS